MRTQSLPQMALQVRQRVDLDGQQNAFGFNTAGSITDSELSSYINGSVAELWDILTSKFGDNYALNTYTLTTVPGTYLYQLPYDFLNIISVDVMNGAIPIAGLRPYNVHERNKYSMGTTMVYPLYGFTNLEYQLQGQNISFIPTTANLPTTLRIQYTPCAPILVAALPSSWAATTSYAQGALVSFSVLSSGVTTSQTFYALNAGVSGGGAPSWNVPGITTDASITWAYQGPTSLFATTFDGISGWEDFVILDSAIKCAVKQEMDVSALLPQRAQMVQRIEWASANRQAGDAKTLTPGWGQMEGGFGGWGGGFGGNI